jgi:hypothetical protein
LLSRTRHTDLRTAGLSRPAAPRTVMAVYETFTSND